MSPKNKIHLIRRLVKLEYSEGQNMTETSKYFLKYCKLIDEN